MLHECAIMVPKRYRKGMETDLTDNACLYVVSYMPNPPRTNIGGFANRMTQFSEWWHYLDYTWLIVATDTANQIYEQLKEYLQATDFILILELRTPFSCAGWLPGEAWEWIRKHPVLTKTRRAKK